MLGTSGHGEADAAAVIRPSLLAMTGPFLFPCADVHRLEELRGPRPWWRRALATGPQSTCIAAVGDGGTLGIPIGGCQQSSRTSTSVSSRSLPALRTCSELYSTLTARLDGFSELEFICVQEEAAVLRFVAAAVNWLSPARERANRSRVFCCLWRLRGVHESISKCILKLLLTLVF